MAVRQATLNRPRESPLGKKQSGRKPQNRSPHFTVYARVDPAIGAAFEKAVARIRPKTSIGGVLEMLMERWLADQPNPPPDEPPS